MVFDAHALPVPDLGLRCRTCGYPLAGLTRPRCPECGRDFDVDDHIPDGDYPIVILNGAEVVLSPEAADLLRVYRIPYMQSTGPLERAYGMTQALYDHCKLAVPRGRYFEAIDLLRRASLGEPLPAPPDLTTGPDWHCESCGEENPGNFAECWNCGAETTAAKAEAAEDSPS